MRLTLDDWKRTLKIHPTAAEVMTNFSGVDLFLT